MSDPRPLRLTFLGNDLWSVPSLEALVASRHEVVLAVTRAPKPAGRGNRLTPTPVAEAAGSLGLPLEEVETVKTGPGFEALAASKPDVLVVVAYGEILPADVLAGPAVAPVNLHFSLLPELRGASPVQTALLLGLERTGVTTMVMDAGMDTGPILRRRPEPVLPQDDAGSLGARLAALGAEVLVETVDDLAAGPIVSTPQEHSLATFSRKLGPQDRRLDWTSSARALVNLVRALSPEPAATTTFRGEGLKVFRAEVADAAGEPGLVLDVSKEGFVVGTGEGGLRPLEIAPAGRRRMNASEFVRGHRPQPGELLT